MLSILNKSKNNITIFNLKSNSISKINIPSDQLISILYYVNEPEIMVGGEHRLYELNNRKPVINKTISPEKGLMVAS